VLVTGAGGFVGAAVVRALVRRGVDVIAAVRPGSRPHRLSGVGAVDVVELDLADGAAVRRTLLDRRPAGLVHLAWYAAPGDYLTSIESVASLGHTIELVELALASGVGKIVAAGTCLEYGDGRAPRREDAPIAPEGLYASAKAAAGLVVRALAERLGGELAWARIFHLHGPDEHPDRLIPRVVRALEAGEAIALSPGHQVRDHLHVDDAGEAIAQLLAPGLAGVFNVCSGAPVELGEVLRTVASIVGRADLLRFGARPYAPREIMFLAGDPARLRATGWRPRYADLRASLGYLARGDRSVAS
jgi:dTDP-6-deoxy-L-talose 4-dehydrogenase (NAD+)